MPGAVICQANRVPAWQHSPSGDDKASALWDLGFHLKALIYSGFLSFGLEWVEKDFISCGDLKAPVAAR